MRQQHTRGNARIWKFRNNTRYISVIVKESAAMKHHHRLSSEHLRHRAQLKDIVNAQLTLAAPEVGEPIRLLKYHPALLCEEHRAVKTYPLMKPAEEIIEISLFLLDDRLVNIKK